MLILLLLLLLLLLMIVIMIMIIITPCRRRGWAARFRTEEDTVGNRHRAQVSQFELCELILLLKLDKQSPVERFEAAVSQSKVTLPPSYRWAPRKISWLPWIRPNANVLKSFSGG